MGLMKRHCGAHEPLEFIYRIVIYMYLQLAEGRRSIAFIRFSKFSIYLSRDTGSPGLEMQIRVDNQYPIGISLLLLIIVRCLPHTRSYLEQVAHTLCESSQPPELKTGVSRDDFAWGGAHLVL